MDGGLWGNVDGNGWGVVGVNVGILSFIVNIINNIRKGIS